MRAWAYRARGDGLGFRIQRLGEHALDVATHVVAAAGYDSTDYATAIDRLVSVGAISSEFAVRFRGIAGFRNLLVHGYLDVDLDLVRKVLSERLAEFDEFARAITRYLKMN